MGNSIDTNWVRDQIIKARVRKNIGNAVLHLLESWEDLDIVLDEKDTLETFSLVEKAVLGHAFLPEESEEVWIEARAGFVHTGDIVRVRHDAFTGPAGRYHNGRRGRVTAVRSGDIIFRSEDELKPFIDGAHYSADKLEKKVL